MIDLARKKITFKKVSFDLPKPIVDSLAQPIKTYKKSNPITPNIVVFITESYSREYISAFNDPTEIKDYVGYSPFLDSLATKSLIFNNAFANGRKSIHGMSSVLAGIPSFKDAFTSSPFANQDVQSIVSILNNEGYDTSFAAIKEGDHIEIRAYHDVKGMPVMDPEWWECDEAQLVGLVD